MSPKTMPVMTADGHRPSDPRRAVKKKPRKKNSSASGATTQTSTATAASATADLSAPSCCGRSSSSLTPTACMNTDHRAENTKNPSQATSNQPTAGQNRVGRRPNCHAFGLRVRNANSTAHSTRPPSCTKVAAMLTAGVGFVLPVTATPISSAKVATAKVPSSASAGSHHGQRGGRAAGGTTPSGSSGLCESEAIGARRVRAAIRSATITGVCDMHADLPPLSHDEYVLDIPRGRGLVAEVRACIECADSPAGACELISPLFAGLLADREWLPPAFQDSAPDSGMGGGIGQWLAFRAADRSLSLFSLVVPSGAPTPGPHPLPRGLGGRYRGTQDEEIFAATDGALDLRERRALGPGDFYVL